MKRFREALKTVMPSREVRRIAGLAYDLRSHTGHQGSLFGSEKTFGYSPHLSLLNVAGDAVFDYVILGELRNASRHVWLPLPGPDGGPVRLAGLEQALPDPWQDYREQRARETPPGSRPRADPPRRRPRRRARHCRGSVPVAAGIWPAGETRLTPATRPSMERR